MRIFKRVFLTVFVLYIFSACSFTKRLYNKGFYIGSHSSVKKAERNNTFDTTAFLAFEKEDKLRKNTYRKNSHKLNFISDDFSKESKNDTVVLRTEPKLQVTIVKPRTAKPGLKTNNPKNYLNSTSKRKKDDPPTSSGANAFDIIGFIFSILALGLSIAFVYGLLAGGLLLALLLGFLLVISWILGFIFSLIAIMLILNKSTPAQEHVLGIIGFGLSLLFLGIIIFLYIRR